MWEYVNLFLVVGGASIEIHLNLRDHKRTEYRSTAEAGVAPVRQSGAHEDPLLGDG